MTFSCNNYTKVVYFYAEMKTKTLKRNKINVVTLGCSKNTFDSEVMMAQLKANRFNVTHESIEDDAEVVIINTCGFIDSAKEESLQAIGEAINENGKVIVTGCLGKQAELITSRHPKVLGVTGPQAYEEVVSHVHRNLPPPAIQSNPFTDLMPPQGIKLTPRHYA